MVVGYLHELKPMDLHAWFEAFVENQWYIFDALMERPVGGADRSRLWERCSRCGIGESFRECNAGKDGGKNALPPKSWTLSAGRAHLDL